MNSLTRPWRALTPARVGLQRAGTGLSTAEALTLAADHALARDAVHAPLDAERLLSVLSTRGHPSSLVRSRATDRGIYLSRPDLGRQLDPVSLANLPAPPQRIAVVIADGLAARAAERHALPLLDQLRTHAPHTWVGVPCVVARQARVALGDAIGEALKDDEHTGDLDGRIVEGALRILEADGGALYIMNKSGTVLQPTYVSKGSPPFVDLPKLVGSTLTSVHAQIRLQAVKVGEGLIGGALTEIGRAHV